MPIITDEKKQNLTLQEVKNKLHKIVQEEKIELRQTIRNVNPLFAKVEDAYVEIKDFLKDYAHAPAKALHKIVQEEKIELRQTIRNANPLFAKVEDGYVEIKDFLKDMTQSLHFHIDLESKKPSINFLDAKAKQFHAPKKDEIKK